VLFRETPTSTADPACPVVEAPQELEILVGRLAEAIPIAQIRSSAIPLLDGEREALLEEGQHIGDDVVVVRSDLASSAARPACA
jgi:hypothetical protein